MIRTRPWRIRLRCAAPLPLQLFGLAVLLAALPLGCSEDETPLGFDEGPRGPAVQLPETLLVSPPVADVGWRPDFRTGAALRIFAGKDEEMKARALVRFGSIPDTTGARRAYVRFYAEQGRGDTLSLAARQVTSAWNADDVTAAAPPETTTAVDPLGVVTGVPTGSIPINVHVPLSDIEIPLSLIREWKSDPASNNGLQISRISGTGIAALVSHNDLIYDENGVRILTPLLVLEIGETPVLRSALATEDAYIVEDLRPPIAGDDSTAAIGAGNIQRFLLRFDISAVPENASIARSTLALYLTSGILSENTPIQPAVNPVRESWQEPGPGEEAPDSLLLGSAVTTATFEGTEDGWLFLEVGGLVQAWTTGLENDGLSVRVVGETSSAKEIYVATSEATVPEHRPRLTIVYVRPPEPRWKEAP
ncbi:MAG: DNRLRE domain-containing protein [Candidatus Eisenbacteria bacterium]|nr:DNRLRE domain-containing protein [Candidatus Eisenbacteria bacterium]